MDKILKKIKKNKIFTVLIVLSLLIGSYYLTTLAVTNLGEIGPTNYDGRYLNFDITFTRGGGNSAGDSYLFNIADTNNLNESSCNAIGGIWQTGSTYSCDIQNINKDIVTTGTCSGSLCTSNSNVYSTSSLNGGQFVISVGQCPDYPGPSLGTVSCNVKIGIDINPSSGINNTNGTIIPCTDCNKNSNQTFIYIPLLLLLVIFLVIVYLKKK